MATKLPDELAAALAALNLRGWCWKLRCRPCEDGLPGEFEYAATIWRPTEGGYLGSRKHLHSNPVTALEHALTDAAASKVSRYNRPRRGTRRNVA